jgi:hypothetical protein
MTTISWLTLFKEIIVIYSVNYTKHIINTLCGQNGCYWMLQQVVHIVTTVF